MIYVAYLDEFGHVGSYVGRSHPQYNTSPVFEFAGFIMPAEAERGFGTWFFKRKAELFTMEGTPEALGAEVAVRRRAEEQVVQP